MGQVSSAFLSTDLPSPLPLPLLRCACLQSLAKAVNSSKRGLGEMKTLIRLSHSMLGLVYLEWLDFWSR